MRHCQLRFLFRFFCFLDISTEKENHENPIQLITCVLAERVIKIGRGVPVPVTVLSLWLSRIEFKKCKIRIRGFKFLSADLGSRPSSPSKVSPSSAASLTDGKKKKTSSKMDEEKRTSYKERLDIYISR